MCQLARGNSFITVEVKDATGWDSLKSRAAGAYETMDVDGLGDKALFMWSLASGASGLFVVKSAYILEINVAGDNTTNLTYARDLAEVALPRLP